MLEKAKWISDSVNILFPLTVNVRDYHRKFEEALKAHFGTPIVMPFPDEFDSEAPRMIFESKLGHSRLVISQMALNLEVHYSLDWQQNEPKRKEYLSNRLPLLLSLLKYLNVEPYLCGMTSKVLVPLIEEEPLEVIHKVCNATGNEGTLVEIQHRTTTIRDEKYYCILSVRNYSHKKQEERPGMIPQIMLNEVTEKGIEITGDFNDRYHYNKMGNNQYEDAFWLNYIESNLKNIKQLIKTLGEA